MTTDDPRRCRNCGQPIEARRIVHGRSSAASDWWVHLDTDRVPCEPADTTALRAAQRRAAGQPVTPVTPGGTGGVIGQDTETSTNTPTLVQPPPDMSDQSDRPPVSLVNKGQNPVTPPVTPRSLGHSDDLIDSFFTDL